MQRLPPYIKASGPKKTNGVQMFYMMFGVVTRLQSLVINFCSPVYNTYNHIDYFLVDKWLLQKVRRSDIETITWSDHASTCISISNQTSPPPHKVWRANTAWKTLPMQINCRTSWWNSFTIMLVLCQIVNLWTAHKAFIRVVLFKLG